MTIAQILTWIPIIALLVAILSLAYQIQRSRFSLNVDLILKLDDRFNSSYFKSIRKTGAQSIKRKTFSEADEIVDFFEMVGALVRRGALDADLVWHSFFYWIHHYKFALDQHISQTRKEDPTIWQDFLYLYDRVTTIEKRKRHCTDKELELNELHIRDFVLDETRLK